MISIGENKAVICKGDFCPAQLYKGETKIAGFTKMDFEGTDGITLENCYNDRIYDAQIRSKNLLDVKKVYPDYVNDKGGITFNEKALYSLYARTNMCDKYKENTRYTFSCDYEITLENNSIYPYVYYTDGTEEGFWLSFGGTLVGETVSGHCKITTKYGKTISRMAFGYTNNNTADVKLTNMQLEEGTSETEYEPPCSDAIVKVTSMEDTNKKHNILLENGILAGEIPTFKGTIVIEIEADVPATIRGKYKRKEE